MSATPVERLNAALEGRYRIERELGEGGMGVVYLAEQSEPVQRKVALKILKPGSDSEDVLARFEAERQALAVMDHPSIAKVFDAGVTDDGRPYFVMELVTGAPMAEFCDERRLTIRQRIELFVEVCHAVQHAHQKGVIHRDLKPSNILVSHDDGRPYPRIIDFGIAKATGAGVFDGTQLTRDDEVIGTPAYMSPEQIDGSGDVDTRTDIFALGVILYEILLGALPYDASAYRGWAAVAAQMHRDPPTPARRFAELADTQKTIAELRSTTPTQLKRELSGDVGWIVSRAMEKDRDRRYETVNAMELDLERLLAHEPVRARGATTAYVVRKFVRRNRLGVAFGGAMVLGLIGFSIVTSVQAERIAEARNRAIQRQGQAEDLLSFLVGDLRSNLTSLGRLDLLDDVANQALEYFASVDLSELSEEELTRQAEVLTQVGEIRVSRVQYPEALAAFREAYGRSAQLYLAQPDDGERLFARSQAEFWIGFLSYREGDWETAREWFTRYLESSLELSSLNPSRPDWMREVGFGYHNLAVLQLEGYGDLEAAQEGFARAASVWDALLVVSPDGQAIQDRVMTLSFQADVSRDLGHAAQYVEYHRETVDLMRQALDQDPDNARWLEQLASYLNNLALAEGWTGSPVAALSQLEEAGRIFTDLILHDSTNQAARASYARARVRRAGALVAQGQITAADSVVSQVILALDGLADTAPDDIQVRRMMRDVSRTKAEIELAMGDLEGALNSIQDAISVAQEEATGREFVLRGEVHAALGQYDPALDSWHAALEILQPQAERSRAPEVLVPLARALLLMGRSAEGDALVDSLNEMGYRPPRPWPRAPVVPVD